MNRAISSLRNGVIAVAVVAPFVYLALNWTAMPDSVPSHFGISGRPDAWGPRWNLFLLPACVVVMVSLLSLGKRFPNRFNHLVPITNENRERQRQLGLGLLDDLQVLIAATLCYISIQQMRTALKLTAGLGVWTMVLFLTAVFGTIGVYLVRSVKAR